MLFTTLLSFLLGVEVAVSEMQSDEFNVYTDLAWAGESVENVTDVSITECVIMCAKRETCHVASYKTERGTCEMLNVADMNADWRVADDETQMVTNMDINFEACVGFWPFDGDVASLWRTTTIMAPSDKVRFEMVPDSTHRAVRFSGASDSYIELENRGDLTVAELTWAAKVRPNSPPDGYMPLFVWQIPDPSHAMCNYTGLAIWLKDNKLVFSYCDEDEDGVKVTYEEHWREVTHGGWHDVAVAYNTISGYLQLRVDGEIGTYLDDLPVPVSGSTTGNVWMGSYFFDGSHRSFSGKIACMRMWNTARNLEHLHDSPLCNIA